MVGALGLVGGGAVDCVVGGVFVCGEVTAGLCPFEAGVEDLAVVIVVEEGAVEAVELPFEVVVLEPGAEVDDPLPVAPAAVLPAGTTNQTPPNP